MAISTHLRLGRVSNLPTVWTNCLAAIVIAGGRPDAAVLTPVLISMSLMYVGGMYLNDAFDQAFDRKYRPERPIPSGEIAGGTVYAIGFGMLLSGLAILVAASPRAEVLISGLVLGGLIVYYDYRHKTDPASPVIMALCRAMVYVSAAAAAATVHSPALIAGAVVLTAYMIGLTYVAKQENLSAVKNLWPLLLLAAPFLYSAGALIEPGISTLLFAGFAAWVGYALSFLLRTQGRSIPRAVVSFIAGISLLDGLLISQVPDYAIWGLAGVVGFGLTLVFQRYVPGT